MKRIIIVGCLVIFVFLVSSAALADLFSWGVMGGVNFATFTGADKGNVSYRTGFSAGAFVSVSPLKGLKFQPEALISLKGARYEFPAPLDDQKINLYYLDIPVLARWYPSLLPLNLNLIAGPYFAFKLSDKIKQGGSSVDANAETFDFGITLGLGVEVKRVLFDARYSFGLTDVFDGATIKNGYFSILAGYRFGKGNDK
jgi:hypothetical protein